MLGALGSSTSCVASNRALSCIILFQDGGEGVHETHCRDAGDMKMRDEIDGCSLGRNVGRSVGNRRMRQGRGSDLGQLRNERQRPMPNVSIGLALAEAPINNHEPSGLSQRAPSRPTRPDTRRRVAPVHRYVGSTSTPSQRPTPRAQRASQRPPRDPRHRSGGPGNRGR